MMAGMDEESDEDLMMDLQTGNHQAFASLVHRHNGKFFAAAYRMCGDGPMAEDIVQDAFLKLWKRPQAWDAARKVKFTTWFYKIVTNLAIDHMRKRKGVSSSEVLDLTPDSRPSPEGALQDRQQQEILESAIQSLPERQKAALNLCVYEGLSNKEAAEILGVGVKALESLLMRAKAGLKEILMRQGVIENEERQQNYGR